MCIWTQETSFPHIGTLHVSIHGARHNSLAVGHPKISTRTYIRCQQFSFLSLCLIDMRITMLPAANEEVWSRKDEL